VKWLRGGAQFDILAALLKEEPWLICHPLIHIQLIRLCRFPSIEPEAFKADLVSGGEYRVTGEVSYDGGFSAARQELRRLIAAWVQGMAGRGWDLKPSGSLLIPPPKRPGRKRTPEDLDWYAQLLSDYECVLTELRQPRIKRMTGELDAQWVRRLEGIIRQAWKDSRVGVELKGTIYRGGHDLQHTYTNWKVRRLPRRLIVAWAQDAHDRSAESPIRAQLAYKMVAYRWNIKPVQVRAAVQTARKPVKK
jgi:hypothetical protein